MALVKLSLLCCVAYVLLNNVECMQNKYSKIVSPLAFVKSVTSKNAIKKINLSGPPCDADQFATCVSNLAKDLGIPEIPQDAEALFFYLMTTVVRKGVQGFEDLCTATKNFEHCLGDTFDTCMSVQCLENAGLDEGDATVYATLAQEMKYECGPAYQVFLNNYQCAYADLKAGGGQIMKCMDIFFDGETDVCKQTQQFSDCYTKIFSNCGADFSVVLCETMKAGFDVSLPQCDVKCNAMEKMSLKKLLQIH